MTTALVPSNSTLTLSYEGPALADNAISVRELAPALLAAGNLFDRSGLLLFGDKATTDLKVSVTRPGSFEVELVLQMKFVASNLLTSPLLVSALNLRQVIVIAIELLKRLRITHDVHPDQEIAEVTEHLSVHLGGLEMTVDGSPKTVETVARETLQIIKDPQVLDAIGRMAEPVRRDGIDEMVIKDKSNRLTSIDKDEINLFEPGSVDDEVRNITVSSQLLRIVSPHLGEGNKKWRLHDGNKINWYFIRDEHFLDEVRRRIRRFAVGDILECDVRIVQQITADGSVKSELEIIRVLSYLTPPGDPPQLGFSGL